MSIKESALTAITSIAQSDFIRAVTSAGASRRITLANLAKAIVESYTGSTLAGSSQSVKSAIDTLATATTITGITAGTNISNIEATSITKVGKIVTGNIVFKVDVEISTNNYVIASGLPSTTYRLQTIGTCVGGSDGQKSRRFSIYQGELTTYYTGNLTAGDTWNVAFSYIVR